MSPMTLQGIAVPSAMVSTPDFKILSQRNQRQEGPGKPFTLGTSTTDTYQLLKDGVLQHIRLRFVGSLVVTLGTGTASSTGLWPYGLLKRARFTANGQSNLIDCDGFDLKAREIMNRLDFDDRGVTQTVGTGHPVSGTLSSASESWGVGSGASLASGTFPVDLEFKVPVADDDEDFSGAIFMSTSSVDMTLGTDYALLSDLFTLTGNATVALTGTWTIRPFKASIPAVNGGIIVPDLSTFHQIVKGSTSAVGVGMNETHITGQGAGKSLLRLWFRAWSGASVLAMNDTNFGELSWAYGSSEIPDAFPSGSDMRAHVEDLYNSDISGVWGYGSHEFKRDLSDIVQEANTNELRLRTSILAGAPSRLDYTTETIFYAGSAA